jgi:hypothetical protein
MRGWVMKSEGSKKVLGVARGRGTYTEIRIALETNLRGEKRSYEESCATGLSVCSGTGWAWALGKLKGFL